MNNNSIKQNIQVVVRIRPMLPNEIKHTKVQSITNTEKEIILDNQSSYEFDQIFGPQASQQEIYQRVASPIIDQFLQGYSTSILAYGQTSSGKTYTLGEPKASLLNDLNKIPETQGLTPRVITEFWRKLKQKQLDSKGDVTFNVKVNFLEVYNEQLQDLLSDNQDQQKELLIRDKIYNGFTQIYIQNATEVNVRSAQEMMGCFITGGKNRMVGETKMNKQSSRSHSVFNIFLDQTINNQVFKSKLSLVDLAGSERLAKTGATKGKQFNEMVGINQGLMALGNCINLLSQKNVGFVPYRDSKLTRILQDSIGGSSKCLFIACVSCSLYNRDESVSTLNYAARAKNIVNKPVKMIEQAQQEQQRLLHLEEENIQLKETLAQMQETLQQYQNGEQLTMQQQEQLQNNTMKLNQSLNRSVHIQLNNDQLEQYQDTMEEVFEKAMQNQHYSYSFAGGLLELYKDFCCQQLIKNDVTEQNLKEFIQLGFKHPNIIDGASPIAQLLLQIGAFLKAFVFNESRIDYNTICQQNIANVTDFTFGDVNKIRKLLNQADKQTDDLLSKTVAEIRLLQQVRPLIGTDWDWSGYERREAFHYQYPNEQYLKVDSELINRKKQVKIIDNDDTYDNEVIIEEEEETILQEPRIDLNASIQDPQKLVKLDNLLSKGVVHESLVDDEGCVQNDYYQEEEEENEEEEMDYDYNEMVGQTAHMDVFTETAPDVQLINQQRPKSARLDPLMLGKQALPHEVTAQLMAEMRKLQPPRSLQNNVAPSASIRPPSTDELVKKLQNLEMFFVDQNFKSKGQETEEELCEIDCSHGSASVSSQAAHSPIAKKSICVDVPNSTRQLDLASLRDVPPAICIDVPSSTRMQTSALTRSQLEVEPLVAQIPPELAARLANARPAKHLEVSGIITQKQPLGVSVPDRKIDVQYKPFEVVSASQIPQPPAFQQSAFQQPIHRQAGPLAVQRPTSANNLKQLSTSQIAKDQPPPRQLNPLVVSTGNARVIEVEARRPSTGGLPKPIDTSQKLVRRASANIQTSVPADQLAAPIVNVVKPVQQIQPQFQQYFPPNRGISQSQNPNYGTKKYDQVPQSQSQVQRMDASGSRQILLRRKPQTQK